MSNKDYLNKIVCDEALKVLPNLESDSIDITLTDPPYFLDKMDNNWSHKKVANVSNQYVIKSLPAGMKFDREQGRRFYEWYSQIAQEIFRLLKPGGFFFSFSSPRLYHRMASALDDAGFEIRDVFIWLYTQNQVKAMSVNHFIDRLDQDKDSKESIKKSLSGWKTPQVKSCFEPIAIAQKPTDQTYLNNMLRHQVGLINTNIRVGNGMYPANVCSSDSIGPLIDKFFLVSKPTKKEKGEFNTHKTVKPVTICEHLIKLSAFSPDAVILDPFVGSGTTAIAAKRLGFSYIGIDSNREYVGIAKKRLANTKVGSMTMHSSGSPKSTKSQLELKVN